VAYGSIDEQTTDRIQQVAIAELRLDEIGIGAEVSSTALVFFGAARAAYNHRNVAHTRRGTKLAAVEELEPLTRAADAYSKAIEYFSKAAAFGTTSQRLREARRRLREVQERLERLLPADADWHAA